MIKIWFYKKIGAEKYYKTQVANRARAWGKVNYQSSTGYRVAEDIFKWATGVNLNHIPNSSKND